MHITNFHEFLEYIFHSNVINFAFVLSFVIWLIKKANIAAMIEKKQNLIKNEIRSSEKDKVDSEKILQESEQNVADVSEKKDEILSNSKKVAGDLAEKLIEDADKQVCVIEKRAEEHIETEKKNVVRDISTKVANAAFTIAQEHIKQAIDEDKHDKFICDFIENIDEMKV